MSGFGGTGMLFVLPFWILFLGLVVWAIAEFLLRSAGNTADGTAADPGSGQNSALYILQQRDARSEISKEEYKQMQDDLTASLFEDTHEEN